MAENTDYEKKSDNAVVTYKFNKGVKCTKVMIGNNDVWKKGDNGVSEPQFIAFNDTVKIVSVRDNDKTVIFKNGTNTGAWKYHMTINRPKPANNAKTGYSSQSAPAPGSASSFVATPVPEAKAETASTGSPGSAETSPDADGPSKNISGQAGTSLTSGCATLTGRESGDGSKVTTPAGRAHGQSGDESAHAAPVAEPAKEEAAPVATPATPKAKVPALVRLLKAEADGTQVEMAENTDFTKKEVLGNDKYEFKSGVKCVSVKIEDVEVWKCGDHSVQEPRYVTYNSTIHKVVVSASNKTLTYKKDSSSVKWNFVGPTAPKTGSTSTGSSSVAVPETGSTGAPGSAEGSGEDQGESSSISGSWSSDKAAHES